MIQDNEVSGAAAMKARVIQSDGMDCKATGN